MHVTFADGSMWVDQEAANRNTFDNGNAEQKYRLHFCDLMYSYLSPNLGDNLTV